MRGEKREMGREVNERKRTQEEKGARRGEERKTTAASWWERQFPTTRHLGVLMATV